MTRSDAACLHQRRAAVSRGHTTASGSCGKQGVPVVGESGSLCADFDPRGGLSCDSCRSFFGFTNPVSVPHSFTPPPPRQQQLDFMDSYAIMHASAFLSLRRDAARPQRGFPCEQRREVVCYEGFDE